MEAKEIKSKLILRGKTQASIARDLEVSRAAVSLVLHGKERSRRIERAIAKQIQTPVNEVFPKGQKR